VIDQYIERESQDMDEIPAPIFYQALRDIFSGVDGWGDGPVRGIGGVGVGKIRGARHERRATHLMCEIDLADLGKKRAS